MPIQGRPEIKLVYYPVPLGRDFLQLMRDDHDAAIRFLQEHRELAQLVAKATGFAERQEKIVREFEQKYGEPLPRTEKEIENWAFKRLPLEETVEFDGYSQDTLRHITWGCFKAMVARELETDSAAKAEAEAKVAERAEMFKDLDCNASEKLRMFVELNPDKVFLDTPELEKETGIKESTIRNCKFWQDLQKLKAYLVEDQLDVLEARAEQVEFEDVSDVEDCAQPRFSPEEVVSHDGLTDAAIDRLATSPDPWPGEPDDMRDRRRVSPRPQAEFQKGYLPGTLPHDCDEDED